MKIISNTKYILLGFCCLLLFATCKKYDENYLWFKNPDKLTPFSGYITAYTINGNDSLEAMNKYIVRAPQISNPKNLNNFEFINSSEKNQKNKVRIVTDNSETIDFDYAFSDKKKSVVINCGLGVIDQHLPVFKSTIMTKNIFIESGLKWHIVRLTKKGKFKIKTTYQGNTYEIAFN